MKDYKREQKQLRLKTFEPYIMGTFLYIIEKLCVEFILLKLKKFVKNIVNKCKS